MFVYLFDLHVRQNDIIYGSADADEIWGGTGTDVIFGVSGARRGTDEAYSTPYLYYICHSNPIQAGRR